MTDRASRPEGTRSIEAIQDDFRTRDYIADRSLATAVFLALELGRPLLLEGEAGVGKTELAKVLAAALGAQLIRLQCYEGLDVNTAVYEWNYPRQMLEIRLLEARGEAEHATAHDIFGRRLPHPPAAAPGARVDGRRRAGPAHRRDRPGRRGVRGLPARDPVRLPGHGPRDRHDQGGHAAAGDPHLEPDPRGPRRAQAPVPVSLDRLPDGPEGIRDRPRPRAGGARAARPRGGRLRPSPARGRPDQGARGSRRRSTGRRRSCRWAHASSRPSWSTRRSASSSSTRRTSARSAATRPAAISPRPAPPADRHRTRT